MTYSIPRISLLLIALLLAACGAPSAGSETGASTPASSDATAVSTATSTPAAATEGTAQTGAAPNQDLRKVTLALGYIPTVQFSPFYLAQQKGYYRDEGLDVEFRHGTVEDLLQVVGSGRDLQYAVASGDEMLVARSQGVPLVYVGSYFQKYPVALIAPQKGGIGSLKQIKGKTIGVPGTFGATYTGLLALLDSAGLSEKDVTIRSIGFTQVQALERGQVDAVMGYVNNEPLQLDQLGVPVRTFPVYESANLVSNGIVTNEENLAANREEVQGLVRATMRGLEETIASPEAAFEATLPYAPEIANQRETQLAVLRASIPLWQSEAAKENGTGYTDPAAWEATRDFLKRTGTLRNDVNVQEAYTNEFIQK